MPPVSSPSSQTNEIPRKSGGGLQESEVDSDHGRTTSFASNHLSAHHHSKNLNDFRTEISPVLASVRGRIFTVLLMIGLLWLVVAWALVDDV